MGGPAWNVKQAGSARADSSTHDSVTLCMLWITLVSYWDRVSDQGCCFPSYLIAEPAYLPPNSTKSHVLSSYHSIPPLFSSLPHSSWIGRDHFSLLSSARRNGRERALLWPSNNKERKREKKKTENETSEENWPVTAIRDIVSLSFSVSSWRPFQKVIQPFTLFHLSSTNERKTSLGCHSSLRPTGS